MSKYIEVQGKSQYDHDIEPRYRPSACGPVTAYVYSAISSLPNKLLPLMSYTEH